MDTRTAPAPAPEPEPGVAIDPVCGMKVDVATAKHVTEHAGHTYYFCNPKCLAKFTAGPQRYLQPAEVVSWLVNDLATC